MKQNIEYDMELHANGKQYGIAFERNGKLFQDDDIDYNIYGFYINGKKVGEFGHTYPKKATFNIDKYLPIIEKMIHNEGFLWGWEKSDAINEDYTRTVDLRDPDDYIPFHEYDAFEQAYKMRLQAKAHELQILVDYTLGEKSPIAVRYKETMHLGVLQPHILVNNNGQFLSFTDCDKAENKVRELIDMERNKEIVKISESQLRNMIAESVKRVLCENKILKEWRVTYEQLNAIERFESTFNDLSEVLTNKTTQYLDTRDKVEEILNSIATDIVNLRVLFHMPEKETDGFGTDGMRAF